MTPKKSVKGCVAAVVLLLSVVSVRPAGATIHGVDIGTGIVPYAGSSDLCAVANSWTEGWNWRCTIDNRAWAHSSVPFEEVAIGSTVTFSKKEVHGKSVSGFDTSNEPALSTFGRDISRLRWYVADSVELDTTTIPSASVMSTGSTGGSGGSFVYWARIRPLSWTRKFETLGDNAVKLRVDYTDGSFEESSGNIKVVADAVTAAVVKTISNGGAADTSNVLTGTTVYVSAGSSTSLSGVFSKFEWDLDGDGTYETDGGTTNTSSTSFTTSGSKTVGVRVTSRGGTTSTATTTIDVRKSPPSGEKVGYMLKNVASERATYGRFLRSRGGRGETLTIPVDDFQDGREVLEDIVYPEVPRVVSAKPFGGHPRVSFRFPSIRRDEQQEGI